MLTQRRMCRLVQPLGRMSRYALFGALIVCSGCSPSQQNDSSEHPSFGPGVVVEGTPVPAIAESHFGPKFSNEFDCKSANGSWGVVGESSKPRCIVPTGDGAKPCYDHSQCLGLCLATANPRIGDKAEGQCASTYYALGCHTWIYSGRAGRRVCLE
jgi:hypothetical protein